MPRNSQSFLERWRNSAAAERANYQLFLSELCDFLDLPRPDPTVVEESQNTYVFEKPVMFVNPDGSTSPGRIDLYRRGHFILEAKQGSNPTGHATDAQVGELAMTAPAERARRHRRGAAIRGTNGWDSAMRAAYFQAERYAKALPAVEGWPPFLITVDVGHSIELYADFSLTGKAYLPFPDSRTHRILLPDVVETTVRDRLRAVWLDPLSLDPARRTAKVTREIAVKLANIARSLERNGHAPKQVAEFLTRCILDLAVLSSSTHINWAMGAGGRLGVGDDPVYSKTTCFDPFPFPSPTEAQRHTIRNLGERLDTHRKRQQQLHPELTLTGMYNVLEKLRAGQDLNEQDHRVYNDGLIGILREIHDDLDRAVFDAYGWPYTLTGNEVLARLLALNAERRAEEASGYIRWLRPDFQAPAEAAQTLPGTVAEAGIEPANTARGRKPWPSAIPAQFSAVRDALRATAAQSPGDIAATFRQARRERVTEILQTLTALGQVRVEGGLYSL